MRQIIFTTSILILLLAGGIVQAQTLQNNYGAPAQPVNVGNGAVNFKIRINGGAGVCAGPTALTVTLPLGFVYVTGSTAVTNGTGSVTETSATGNTAVLSVSNIPAAPDSTVITYRAYAGCGVIGGTGTTITYNLAGCAGTATASATINALNAQLNFVTVTNASFTDAPGSVYSRDYTIRNDGYGAIDTFYIDSKNGAGIEHAGFSPAANITLTTVISGSDTIYRYRIVKAGGLLTGEIFTLTETLRIKCASGASLQGELKTWFGYGGTECTAVSNNYTVGASIDPNQRPNLAIAIINMTGPLCRGTSAMDTIRLINTGTSTAYRPRFVLSSNNFGYSMQDFFTINNGGTSPAFVTGSGISGLGLNSIRIKINSGAWTGVTADSVVNQNMFPNTAGTEVANSCFTTDDKAGLFAHLPDIHSNDTVYICFAEKNCIYTDCQNDWQAAIGVGLEYTDACGTKTRTTDAIREANVTDALISPTDFPTDVSVGDVFSLSYNINPANPSGYNGHNGAMLRFTVTLPAEFTWTGNTADVFFLSSCGQITNGTAFYDAGTREIVYEFANIANTTCYNGSYMQINNVSVLPASTGSVTIAHRVSTKRQNPCTDYYKLSCGQSPPIKIHGSTPGPCTGINPVGVTALRTNYGSPDMDNDNQPDAGGSIDLNKVKTRYVMSGDTLEITYKAKVVVNGLTPAAGFKYGAIKTAYTALTEKMQPMYAVTVLYDNTGAVAGTETTSFTFGSGTSSLAFNINDLKDAAPSRTAFMDGDSIVIKKYFKIIPQNPVTQQDNGDFVAQVNINNNYYLSDVPDPAPAGNQYACENYGGQFTMVSHTARMHLDAPVVIGCGTSIIYAHFYSNVGGGFPFIFEHRPVTTGKVMTVSLPAGGVYISSGYPPVNAAANPLVFEINQPVPTSESLDILNAITYRTECDAPFTGSINLSMTYTQMPGFDTVYSVAGNNYSLSAKTNLAIASPNVTQTVNTANVNWDIQIDNLGIAGYSAAVGTSPNLWIAKGSGVSSVMIDSIAALSGPNGTPVNLLPVANNFYQAGNLAGFSSGYFRIYAHTTNCSNDSINIMYGYDCIAYPASPADVKCPKYIKLYVISQLPALQLSIISQPSGSVDLCQDLPYEVEVINSGLGTANTLKVTIPIPAGGGLEYVPGTYGIKYPITGSYATLADLNVAVAGTNLVFTVPVADIPAFAGSDRYRIRFSLRATSCNFTSGQALTFVPNGNNGCLAPIVGTAATTGRIRLTGAPVNLPVFSITSSADTVIACGSGALTTNYKFKIINTGGNPTSAADGFTVTLPSPWTMATGVSYLHNPSGAAFSGSTGTGIYNFKTGAGLAIGDSIVYTTMLTVPNASVLACGAAASTITENGFAEFSVTCISTGITCVTKQVIEPDHTTGIFVKRPSYNITSLTGAAAADPVSGTPNTNVAGQFTIVNANSTFVAQTAVLNLYKDVNQNGVYDAGDLFINSGSFPLSAGASQTFNYNFAKPAGMAGDICPLVAVLTLNCNCSPATFSLNCSFVLPVKLESFTAAGKDCKALLSWKTTSETNFKNFEIEYSANGTTFTKAGSVAGSNNINGSIYKFTYVQPDVKGYYRLKMTDLDGRFEYSKVIPVNVDCNERIIAVSPNPSHGIITVTGLKAGDYLQVYSIDGRLLLKKTITGTQLQLDLTQYASDVFTISVLKNDGTVTTAKVVKIK